MDLLYVGVDGVLGGKVNCVLEDLFAEIFEQLPMIFGQSGIDKHSDGFVDFLITLALSVEKQPRQFNHTDKGSQPKIV